MSETWEAAAKLLRDAYTGGVVAPLRDYLDPVDVVGAYGVQEINTRFWEAQGRQIVGRKAGLTAKAVQKQLGVDQPDFGVLFDDMRVADGGVLPAGAASSPRPKPRSPSFSAPICLRRKRPRTTWLRRFPRFMRRSRSSIPHCRLEDHVRRHGCRQRLVRLLRARRRRAFARRDGYLHRRDGDGSERRDRLGRGRAAAWAIRSTLLPGLRARLPRAANRSRPGTLLAGALGPMVPLNPGDHVVARVGGIGTCSFTRKGLKSMGKTRWPSSARATSAPT
jgi:2-keto-4-pentenoate hydratase